MKKLFKLILFLLLVGLIIGGFFWIRQKKEDNNAWKVEITNAYINVRSKANIYDAKIGTVRKGNAYKVLEQKLDDEKYVWYKIEYDKKKVGWIASDRYDPYVKEINTPESNEKHKNPLEYTPPIIKYFEDVYKVLDINHITYDHLTIEEQSEYTVKHYVYFDEKPKDKPTSQYWIEYVVEDEWGNKSSSVQLIEFEIAPSKTEVLDIKDLEAKRS